MKIQITMSRKEIARTMKLIDAFGSIVEKVFGKTFKKVNFSADSQMDPANNNVCYGVGYRSEVIYTADEMAVSINIKEKMYDASCAFFEKIAEKAAPLITFCMGGIKLFEAFFEKAAEKATPEIKFFMDGIKMLEDFCKSFKSDAEIIHKECFEELEKELEDNARYAVICLNTIDGNPQISVFKRYSDSKMTSIEYNVFDDNAIGYESNQLKAFGNKLDDSKFIFNNLNEAICEAYEMCDRCSNDQCVQEEKGE